MNQKETLNENEIKAVMADFMTSLNAKPAKPHPKWVIIGRDKGLEVGEWQ
jgi:hypothetical protein